MKKIRTLTVIFDQQIQPWEVPSFRSAIIEKVGREHMMFHQHLPSGASLNKYPLIQYKCIKGSPAIQCFGEGVEEIHKFFNHKDWQINVNGRPLDLKIEKLELNTITVNVWNKNLQFGIATWLGFNDENFAKYKLIKSLSEKIEFLERILTGNIISMAKGIDWDIPREINLKIEDIRNEKLVTYKNIKLNAFDLVFNCNVSMPAYIGLGKGVSKGFGVVRQLKTQIEE